MNQKIIELFEVFVKRGTSESYKEYNGDSYHDGFRDGQFDLAKTMIKAIRLAEEKLAERTK